MKTLTITLVLGVALMARALYAQPGPGPQGRQGGRPGMMQNLDTNGDGEIDEAEARQAAANRIEAARRQLAQILERFDENGDGRIGEDELKKLENQMGTDRRLGMQKRMLQLVDTDGDWIISDDEEKDATEKLTEMLGKGDQRGEDGPGRRWQPTDPDTNGNCIIDDDEAKAAAVQELERMKMMMERMKEHFGDNPDGRFPGRIAEFDKNKDWVLDEQEVADFLKSRTESIQERNARVLKIFDDDNDGKLNEAEAAVAKKAFEYMEEERQAQRGRMREGMRGRMDQRGPGGSRSGRRRPQPPQQQ